MQELMKSMRAATLTSGMLDNEGSKLGTEMLDQQFATQMTGLPGGLSEAITRQLERQMGMAPGPIPAPAPATAAAAARAARRASPTSSAGRLRAAAHRRRRRPPKRATGIPAAFMIGQAAHETRLGPARDPPRRRQRRRTTCSASRPAPTGRARWPRSRPPSTSTAAPRKVVAKFRAYASYAESFADYARLMKDSPRYQPVLAQAPGRRQLCRRACSAPATPPTRPMPTS